MHKKRRGSKRDSAIKDLPYGVRMKGGIIFDEKLRAYIAIVHSWDNVHCLGEPEEWRSQEVFSNEDDAMNYYKVKIRPALQRLMSEIENDSSKIKVTHKKLE